MRIFGKLFSDFNAPVDKESESLVASYLNVILLVAIVVTPVFLVVKLIQNGLIAPSDYMKLFMEAINLFLYYLLKKNKVLLSGLLFLIISWIALTFMALADNGVQDVAIVAYILLIFNATLISGIRVAFAMTVLSIISVWIMGVAEMKFGFMYIYNEPLVYSRDYTLIFVFVLTSIILFARSYRYSYERINRELNERIKAEEKLSENEIRLIEKSKELTAAKEKAEESDRLKTAFLNNISHEIRTPMNGIVGFLDLLQQPGIKEEERKKYIGIVNSCTKQLSSMVSDFIDISKIETGSLELFLSVFNLEQFQKDIEDEWSGLVRDKGLSFTISNEVGIIDIKSDKSKIHQILSNLVSNAVKFTRTGGINIKFSRSDEYLHVSVADTGIGIEEAHRVLIFDRFRQTTSGLSRSYGGAGLGLAISKGYADFLGGTIEVNSQPMAGSVFTFKVPVKYLS